MKSILKCPVCHRPLVLSAAAAVCEARHSFDRARNGYLNLLLSTQRHSPEPGDSPAMLRSRRAILQSGLYDVMARATNAAVADALDDRRGTRIADLGCGEGFFLRRLAEHLAGNAHELYGVDISRTGIKMAASAAPDLTWVVASLHESPFLPGSLDAALSMFAPIAAQDIRRVLRDDGVLITVTPGPDHLDALRAIIYPSVVPHPLTPALADGEALFTLVDTRRARAEATVESQERVMDLLAMTPYYWNISRETRARVDACSRLEFTVDVSINVFRPSAPAGDQG